MIHIITDRKKQCATSLSLSLFPYCSLLIFFLIYPFVCKAQLPDFLVQTAGSDTNVTGNILDRFADFTNKKLLPEYTIHSNNKNYSSGNELLDSLYQIISSGYTQENYRWYFYYDQDFVLDSSKRMYYTPKNLFVNIVEIRTYNPNGQITRMVTTQGPSYDFLFDVPDTTILRRSIENYTYDNNGNLIKISTTNKDMTTIGPNGITYSYSTQSDSFSYDNNNRLISDISNVDTGLYFYEGDSVKYHTYVTGDVYNGLEKYDSTGSDSTGIIKDDLSYSYRNNSSQQPDFDTVSIWDKIDQYTIIYDKLGRKISLVHRNTFNRFPPPYNGDYKATYFYTASDMLSHVSYYTWDSTAWNEAMRLNYTYDADDNIQTYKKTYYDARTNKWEVQESKTYYYSPLTGIRNVEIAKPGELNVYPNPAHDIITVKKLNGPAFNYTIYNSYGEVRTVGRLENSEIMVSQLRPGMYIIKIHNNHSAWCGEFVKY